MRHLVTFNKCLIFSSQKLCFLEFIDMRILEQFLELSGMVLGRGVMLHVKNKCRNSHLLMLFLLDMQIYLGCLSILVVSKIFMSFIPVFVSVCETTLPCVSMCDKVRDYSCVQCCGFMSMQMIWQGASVISKSEFLDFSGNFLLVVTVIQPQSTIIGRCELEFSQLVVLFLSERLYEENCSCVRMSILLMDLFLSIRVCTFYFLFFHYKRQ